MKPKNNLDEIDTKESKFNFENYLKLKDKLSKMVKYDLKFKKLIDGHSNGPKSLLKSA